MPPPLFHFVAGHTDIGTLVRNTSGSLPTAVRLSKAGSPAPPAISWVRNVSLVAVLALVFLLAGRGLDAMGGWLATSLALGLALGAGLVRIRDLSRALEHERDERERVEEAARFLTFHDPVTGLPNRVLLMDRLRLELEHRKRDNSKVAVMFLDLDNFKSINDRFGHAAGDELLERFGARLRGYLRRSDTIARFGADEFALVLPGMRTLDDVTRVAAKLMTWREQEIEVAGQKAVVSFCIGIAVGPDDADDPDTLLRNASMAMTRAKTSGRGGLAVFDMAMHDNVTKRLQIESELRHVVDAQQLTNHYQPQIDRQTGRVVGLEALVRWNHPRTGIISPALFIPIAEDTGAIKDIGLWVLETACRQVRQWQQIIGHDGLRLAVNLSPVQLRDSNIVDHVERVLKETGFAPELLELEITEAVILKGDANARDALARLRGLGVKLAIDDFGTGYSSLSYLQRFRVDALKIDRSFVIDLADNENSQVIVRAVIAMGKALDLRIIAEGVETEEQSAQLMALGSQEMQGFLFSKPMPSEEAERYLRRSNVPLPS